MADGFLDRCRSCSRIHTTNFPFLQWDELVRRKRERDFEICDALEQIEHPTIDDFRPCDVQYHQHFVLEVCKHFRVLTEQELRKAMCVPRLSKQATKSLTTVSLPSDKVAGELEPCYLFRDADELGRHLVVKQLLSTSMNERSMDMGAHHWGNQAQRIWEHETAELGRSSGAWALEERYPTLAEHLAKHGREENVQEGAGAAADEAAEGDANNDEAGSDHDDEDPPVPGNEAAQPPRIERKRSSRSLTHATPPSSQKRPRSTAATGSKMTEAILVEDTDDPGEGGSEFSGELVSRLSERSPHTKAA